MFEPVHGSAPDIAWKNLANPIVNFCAAAMMLNHLGEFEVEALLMRAIEQTTEKGTVLTRDSGGKSSPRM